MVKSRKTCIMCKTSKGANITYHRFPSNLSMSEKWCDALGLNLNDLPKYAYVCSRHFMRDEFTGSRTRKTIAKHAIPKHLHSIRTRTISSSSESDPQRKSDQDSTETATASSRTLTVSEVDNHSITPLSILSERNLNTTDTASSTTLTVSEIESPSSVNSSYKGLSNILSERQSESNTGDQLYSLDSISEENKENVPVHTSSAVPRKRKLHNPRHFGDIESEDLEDPKKRKICWDIVKRTIHMQRKKISSLVAKKRRREKKIYSLESLTAYLRKQNLISENAQITLNSSVAESAKQLFSRVMKSKRTRQYPPELRQFALTLSFYSRKAYNYVRRIFSNALPHTRTLSKWYSTIDASPGFMKEAISALKLKCLDAAQKDNKILCNLVLDEMSIRKKIEWDGRKTYGYVDLGLGIDNEELEEAKEVLVFMLVALNSSWKIPVGYFLTNGLTSSEKATLVTNCLEFVHQSSVTVTSVTFDGAPSNISMANLLGANLAVTNLQSYFIHPITNEKVYIFLDPCHMIKLVRNSLGNQKILEDGEGNTISWKFLEMLCEFQNSEGLHAATKLRARHMSWIREKMKVSLAVQTLSKSVAEALDFLNLDLRLPQFCNSEGTAIFCRQFNNLFDILNSRNVLTKKPFEKPLSSATENKYFKYMDDCIEYIKNLKIEGKSILTTKKKVGFLGFIVCMASLKGIYIDRVKTLKQLKYLLTYKLSQDHLEIFFSCIRSKGGYNNNPTSRQFQSIMKRLLIHSEISGSEKANAVALDSTSILHCSSAIPKIYDETLDMPELHDNINMYSLTTISWNLTLYSEDIIAYVAGFVVKQLKQHIKCLTCLSIIEGTDVISKLQIRKTFGALIKASQFIIEVCKFSEKSFRNYKHLFGIQGKNINSIYIKIKAMSNIPRHLLDYFSDHIYDDEPLSNHFNMVVNLVLDKYFQLRFHHEISQFQDKQKRVRSLLTKTILFKNQ